ncbi:ubiquitin protein ligase binding protein [Aureococcus anophagefferens]|uniref:Ubiquitin protein ligase binding protein n=1 Tax=Aureococcus anophagefferens TaxID=44056 RepID=A0ABR1FYG2_AURAN
MSTKGKFVIKPFRPHCQMDAEQAQRIWAQLRLAVSEIYNKNASVLSFEELYGARAARNIKWIALSDSGV